MQVEATPIRILIVSSRGSAITAPLVSLMGEMDLVQRFDLVVSGSEAKRLFAANDYDLIVADMVIDSSAFGVELTREMTQSRPDTFVVIHSQIDTGNEKHVTFFVRQINLVSRLSLIISGIALEKARRAKT